MSAPFHPAQLSAGHYTTPGLRGLREHYQHDRLICKVSQTASVFAVFDGHGPTAHGHIISDMCARTFIPLLERHPCWHSDNIGRKEHDPDLITALRHVVAKLEEQSLIITERVRQFSGTTLCVLVLKDGFLYSVNIGDSRAVLAVAPEEGRSKFVSVQLTTDHVCQDVHERERIERNGGWVQEGRLNGDLDMSRTIGDHEFKKYRNQKQFNAAPRQFGQHLLIATPDVSVRRVLQRDAFVVLATDGVWSDCVSNELVVKTAEIFLNGGKHPAQAAMGVATLALNLGSEDNVSVVVVALRPIEPQERARRRDRIRARMGNGASSGNTNRVTSRPFFRRKPISPEDDRTVHNEHRFVEFKQHESESNDSVTPGEVDTSTS